MPPNLPHIRGGGKGDWAARTSRNSGDASRARLTTGGTMRSLPLRTLSCGVRPICAMALAPACFSREKFADTCHCNDPSTKRAPPHPRRFPAGDSVDHLIRQRGPGRRSRSSAIKSAGPSPRWDC